MKFYKWIREKLGIPVFEPFFWRDNNIGYLRFATASNPFGGYLIRPLEKEEYDMPVWDMLGVSEEELDKDPSLGCRNKTEAVIRATKVKNR